MTLHVKAMHHLHPLHSLWSSLEGSCKAYWRMSSATSSLIAAGLAQDPGNPWAGCSRLKVQKLTARLECLLLSSHMFYSQSENAKNGVIKRYLPVWWRDVLPCPAMADERINLHTGNGSSKVSWKNISWSWEQIARVSSWETWRGVGPGEDANLEFHACNRVHKTQS